MLISAWNRKWRGKRDVSAGRRTGAPPPSLDGRQLVRRRICSATGLGPWGSLRSSPRASPGTMRCPVRARDLPRPNPCRGSPGGAWTAVDTPVRQVRVAGRTQSEWPLRSRGEARCQRPGRGLRGADDPSPDFGERRTAPRDRPLRIRVCPLPWGEGDSRSGSWSHEPANANESWRMIGVGRLIARRRRGAAALGAGGEPV